MERRYDDDEVREIFERAALRDDHGIPVRGAAGRGLTLSDLEDIGREAGLNPAAIARAAVALDVDRVSSPQRTSLGMPIEVGRLVPLPRPLTDSEWERLVTELRTTFGARGRVSSEGGLREWVNGNLHACVEPSDAGYHLRLGTLKGDAAMLNAIGATAIVTGAVAFGSLLISSGLQDAVFVPWMISGSGVAAVLANLVRLPRWAGHRTQQMDHIASTVRSIISGPTSSDGRAE